MPKVIIINKCSHCNYRRRMTGGIFRRTIYYVCLNSTTTYTFDPKSQPREIIDSETIPEWCRLKEAIPNLKELQYEYNKNEMLKQYRNEHGITSDTQERVSE